MFPTSPLSGSTTVPGEATFWMPKPEDIDDDGIGVLIHDTWLIKDVPVREARRLRQEESRIAEVVGRLATTPEDFDRLATAVEEGLEPDGDYSLTNTERAELGQVLSDDEATPLDSLELGVGRARVRPCYGSHHSSCQLSRASGRPGLVPLPVVLFATTEYRAEALQPLVEATDCQFGIDARRPDLLAVMGRSILDTMALAEAVLESRRTFVQPKPSRRARPDQRRLA